MTLEKKMTLAKFAKKCLDVYYARVSIIDGINGPTVYDTITYWRDLSTYNGFYVCIEVDEICEGKFNTYFGHKDVGYLYGFEHMYYTDLDMIVKDFWGGAQRMMIKTYDGKNQPTTLKQEVGRIQIYEDDKFKVGKFRKSDEHIKELQDLMDKGGFRYVM